MRFRALKQTNGFALFDTSCGRMGNSSSIWDFTAAYVDTENCIEATPDQSFMHCCKAGEDLAPKQMGGKNRRWVRMYFVFCLLQKALQQLVLMGRGESCLPSLLHKAVTTKLYLLCIVFLVLCKRFLLTAEIWQAFHKPPILISGQVWLSTSRGIAQVDLPIATSPARAFQMKIKSLLHSSSLHMQTALTQAVCVRWFPTSNCHGKKGK